MTDAHSATKQLVEISRKAALGSLPQSEKFLWRCREAFVHLTSACGAIDHRQPPEPHDGKQPELVDFFVLSNLLHQVTEAALQDRPTRKRGQMADPVHAVKQILDALAAPKDDESKRLAKMVRPTRAASRLNPFANIARTTFGAALGVEYHRDLDRMVGAWRTKYAQPPTSKVKRAKSEKS